jgi:hypothetical protein
VSDAAAISHKIEGLSDRVVVLPCADGGLISYARINGTMLHTLNTPDGFERKLRQLGLKYGAYRNKEPSMRVHYMSDLHLEFSRPVNLPTGEVLLLAGDITVARCLDPRKTDANSRSIRRAALRFFDQARANFEQVIYLAGNHEHYRGDIGETADIIRTHLASENLAFVENEAISIGNVTFLCATLWTDMDRRDLYTMRDVGLGLNDFTLIASGKGKFLPEHAVDLHEQSLDWLSSELESRQNEKIIVVTHHAPSLQGLHPDYGGNELSAVRSEL